jgi:hypothetical protein
MKRAEKVEVTVAHNSGLQGTTNGEGCTPHVYESNNFSSGHLKVVKSSTKQLSITEKNIKDIFFSPLCNKLQQC